MAYQCDSWGTFLEGRCAYCGHDKMRCRLMGLYPSYWKQIKSTQKTIGFKYFVNAAPKEEFCCKLAQNQI